MHNVWFWLVSRQENSAAIQAIAAIVGGIFAFLTIVFALLALRASRRQLQLMADDLAQSRIDNAAAHRMQTRPILHVATTKRPQSKVVIDIENIGSGPAVMLMIGFGQSRQNEVLPFGHLWHLDDRTSKTNHFGVALKPGAHHVLEMPMPTGDRDLMVLDYFDIERNRYQTQFLFPSPKRDPYTGLCAFAEPSVQVLTDVQEGVTYPVPEPYIVGAPDADEAKRQ